MATARVRFPVDLLGRLLHYWRERGEELSAKEALARSIEEGSDKLETLGKCAGCGSAVDFQIVGLPSEKRRAE